MKTKFLLMLLFLSTGTALTAAAQDAEPELTSGELMNYVGYGTIVFVLLVFVVAMLVVLRAVNAISKVILGSEAFKETAEGAAFAKKEKVSTVNRLLSLRPLSEEKDLIIEHEYDGIQELDNPTPAWFMYLFYGTIVFAFVYLMVYHVLGVGQLQDEEYKTEMAVANKQKEAFLAKSGSNIDEKSVKLSTDPGDLAAGKSVFTASCAPCHGVQGQGVVGPNLTDDYWLHGGSVNAIFKTIKYGVTDKGMPTWEKQLSPKQIADVANYIKSLHGTNPPNPKEPQGQKEEGGGDAGAKTASL
ncbi:cbb3-type cytochrome c oxidase N-terminal domain-containing protein [Mucilaginibacter auburnensis]|uniref:Cytochrome c oxidase cbb3-type subunit 3 n=1 Tax=Mucilaginibacter auburnensis TaxID=1457233 RepID=A0A2H9VRW5_9SPHI|nr:cbb3-type cytochrome c oxidase N-terminal domain-containing protein [Mucilaginibacter auburnensis]PJJ83539.1 cytochrome c oxidase cbb3-type subunit 3 [Mucilaginibacter auburnensis]